MIRRLWKRFDPPPAEEEGASVRNLVHPDLPLPYSWVLTRRLAVGPMPASPAHWKQLEQAGLRARFSCCYPLEPAPAPPPPRWRSDGVPLPDHREQEPLEIERLAEALERAGRLLSEAAPLYLHCLAGVERSPLLAVGLTAWQRHLSLFDALDWVRRCHPPARPIASHLEQLERLLRQG